jgi:hypothetical protein
MTRCEILDRIADALHRGFRTTTEWPRRGDGSPLREAMKSCWKQKRADRGLKVTGSKPQHESNATPDCLQLSLEEKGHPKWVAQVGKETTAFSITEARLIISTTRLQSAH